MGAPLELVASDVLDHYRTYALLERLLYTPTKLSEQPSFQLDAESQQLLIEKYEQHTLVDSQYKFGDFNLAGIIIWTIRWPVRC